MRLVSRACWSLGGSLACLGAVVNAAGVVDIGVVFPRNNETYAPTDKFPIVFAVQNAELAKHLRPSIYSLIRNGSRLEGVFGYLIRDLTYANYSSEPYFAYSYENIDTEGRHLLSFTISWQSCDESGDQVAILSNTTSFGVNFNIKRGAQEVDLVAATANEETCSAKGGVAINVTDEIHDVPAVWRQPAGTCAVLASSSPTPTANPCRVKIDAAVAASMSASWHAELCKLRNPPADCPKENSVQQLAVAGVANFAAAFGVIGIFLA
jgi:hypothetical protein